MFYGDLYSLWFDEVKANQEAIGASYLRVISETFRNGGYYRWDFTDNFSLLSFNSIFSNFRNHETDKAEEDQLQWLEEQLNEGKGTKFIIQMHIPPGIWYYSRDE